MQQIDDAKMRVLLVESSANHEHLSAIFTPHSNYSVDSALGVTCRLETASSYAQAINCFQDNHPDIVVIELGSSLEEAFDFVAAVRADDDNRHTGIVFLQGSQEMTDSLPASCLEAGGDDFIEQKSNERETLARVATVYRFKLMTDKLRSANHRLRQLSLTDELTGLHNMRSFNKLYRKVIRDAEQLKSGFGMIMLDLDHFKTINDTTNHLMGSHVISEVGRLIKEGVADIKGSIPARYGGDEYVICLPSDNPQEVLAIGQLICATIRSHVFEYDGNSVSITASLGVSWVPMGYKGIADGPLKAADLMLYRSKDQGRDQVNGMMLRDAVDLDHVSRLHLIDGDTSSDHHNVVPIHNIKIF